MSEIQKYIEIIKNQNHNNDNCIAIGDFIKTFIDQDGYVFIDDLFIDSFISLLKFIVKNTSNDINLLNFIEINKNKIITFKNNKMFYNDLFEQSALGTSSLITTNLYFENITILIYQIYIYGTTINNFEQYLEYNKDLYYKNNDINDIKILDNHMSNINVFDDSISSIGYKILIMGHLSNNYIRILNKKIKIIIENPLTMYGRVTLELLKRTENHIPIDNINIVEIYNKIYYKKIIPSTPIFYNALKKSNLLTSCFILNTEDTTESISNLYKKASYIQKYNSGIGINLSKIRARGRPVMDQTDANGIMAHVDILALLTEQYKNHRRQRSSNTNINMSIDHPEILDFILIRTNNNRKDGIPINNIFTTISIPDEFIYRYLVGLSWYFISPEQTLDGKTHLYDVYGEEYSKLYNKMINNENIEKIEIDSNKLLSEIVNIQIQTGTPFIFFRDTVNYTSNHKNHGIIQATNLCTEILEYNDENETACCNLLSLNIKKFINNGEFDFIDFIETIKQSVYILNNTIDNGFYSEITCKNSNDKKRPIGIGIQGFINACYQLNIDDLEERGDFLRKITEYMYYYSLLSSANFSKLKVFKSYNPEILSPLHNGIYSFDLFTNMQLHRQEKLQEFGLDDLCETIKTDCSLKYINKKEIDYLTSIIKENGICNSLTIAFMPTSLSATLHDNIESFELPIYNIYKKLLSKYDIIIYNKDLVQYLLDKKYYTHNNVIMSLLKVNGDINLLDIPMVEKEKLIKKFYTMYQVSEKDYINYNTSNNPFVDQGKSTNLYIFNNDPDKLAYSIFLHWFNGSKTTYYYQSYINNDPLIIENETLETNLICTKKESCTACSS